MKRVLILLFAAFLSFSVSMVADDNEGKKKKFDRENFCRQLENYITEKARLTDKEAEAFFPVYHEMKEKQFRIGRRIMRLKKEPKNVENGEYDDEEWAEMVVEVESLKVKQAEIGHEYMQRFVKILPGKKLFKVMKAEDAFHRKALKDLPRGER